jgi:hypothetical protein
MDPRAGVCHGKWTRPGIANSFAPIENCHSVWGGQKRKKQNIRKVGQKTQEISKSKDKQRSQDSNIFSFTVT